MKPITIALVNLLFVGCASPTKNPVTPLNDGSYLIHQEDHAGIFGSLSELRASVDKQVNEFAQKEGKEVVVVSDAQKPVGNTPGAWAWYEKKFRLIDPKEKQAALSCFDGVKKNPSLQIIADKVGLGGVQDQTFTMLSNSNLATESERKAIGLYGDLCQKCNSQIEKYTQQLGWPTSLTALNKATNSAGSNILIALYEAKMTYGEYAKLRQELSNNHDTAMANIEAEIKRNATDAHEKAQMIANQTAIAQAQIAQANASNTAAAAMMINATKPIPIRNNNLNCTSQVIGNNVNTNCY
jgi:hypothetical protein